jgi:hypothetical protein
VSEQWIQNHLLTCGVSEFYPTASRLYVFSIEMCVQSVAVLRSKSADLQQNIDWAKERPPGHRYWFG